GRPQGPYQRNGRGLDEVPSPVVRGEQALDLDDQPRIIACFPREQRAPLVRTECQRGVEQSLDPVPPSRRHESSSVPSIASYSQALANAPSRSTVAPEICSPSAISSVVSPP